MESRKRPHEGEEPVSVKKRAIISSNDSPVTAVSSTAADDQPLFTAELEVSGQIRFKAHNRHTLAISIYYESWE